MELPTHLLALAGLIALLFHLRFRRKNARGSVTKNASIAPEPAGALPIVGHLHLLTARAPAARILAAIADKSGAVFSLRLGSHPALVVSSWEAVKECFTVNDTIFASRPLMALGKHMGYDHAVFALAPYGPYWRDVRKIVTLELMTSHSLEKLRHVRESEVNLGVRDLHMRCKRGADVGTADVAMNEWFEHLTFNIIVRMLSGKRYSGDGEDKRFKEAIKSSLYLSGLFVVSDAIPWLEWADIGGHLKEMKKTGKKIDSVLGQWLEEHIQKRKEGAGAPGDFIDTMLSVLPENVVISGYDRDTVIKSTVLILIMTGSESTAETLTWGLSLLLNHPHALQIAQKELDDVVGRERWVQESDIANLNYLQAIVKETLRLYPPGPLSGPREAIEDCWVNGYRVQKGTRLIVNLWKLQRDPRVWPKPEEFRPERFLAGDHAGVGFRGGQQFEYIPFSAGRRMCPGVNFGLQVVQLALARLLQGFNLSTPAKAPVDMTEGVGLALPKVHPLEVVVSPRLSPEAYEKL